MSLETVTPRNERGWGLSGAHDPMEEDGHGWGPEALPTQPHPGTPPSWDWACWDTSPTINPLPLTAVAEELQREVAEAGFGDCPASPALPTLSPESDALSDYAPSPRDSAGDGDVEGLARVADVADGMSVVETPLLFDAFTDRSEDPYSPTPWPPANPHNDNTDLFADLDVSGGGGVLSAATPGALGGMEVHATPPAFSGTPTPAPTTENDAIEMSEGAPSENGSHGMERVGGGTRRSTRRTRRQGSFAIKPDPDDFDDDDAPYSPVPHVARRTATGCGKAKVRVKTEPWLTDQHSQMLAHAGAAMAEAQDSKSWHTAEDAAPNRRRRTKETEEIRDELDAAIYSLFPMWTLRLDRTEFKVPLCLPVAHSPRSCFILPTTRLTYFVAGVCVFVLVVVSLGTHRSVSDLLGVACHCRDAGAHGGGDEAAGTDPPDSPRSGLR